MRLRLTSTSGLPIYRQIVDQIADQIACGRLIIGERLPSVRELASTLPANQNTILKAYDILERAGLLVRRHGDGTFVAARGANLGADERRQVLAEVLGHAARKATLYDVAPAELHSILDEQLARAAEDAALAPDSRGQATDPRENRPQPTLPSTASPGSLNQPQTNGEAHHE